MNNKVNYSLVGFLVILGFTLMIGFSYWLLKPSVEDENTNYLIYFQESVLGLNIDAAVKYRGISVGKVSRLRINPRNSEEVEVLITILKSTPIKSSTVAKLTSQGITGLSYINLNLGDNGAPSLKAEDGQLYPVIKSEASFLERFGQSLDSVSEKLSGTLSGTEQLLNDENQKQFALILNKTAIVMDKLDRVLDEQTIENIHKGVKNFESTSAKMDEIMPNVAILLNKSIVFQEEIGKSLTEKIMPNVNSLVSKSIVWEEEIGKSFTSIMESYLGMRSSADQVKKSLENGEFNLKAIAGDSVPTINSTLLEMQQLMIKIQDAVNHYERSPQDILFQYEEIKKGPGEK